jgi:hypothetical protein
MALMHLYYGIPTYLKLNGNDLKNALRKDPAIKNDIKRDQKLLPARLFLPNAFCRGTS